MSCICFCTFEEVVTFSQTLWTDLNKRSLSPVAGGILNHAITPDLVLQGPKCGGMWCHQVLGGGHGASFTQATGIHSFKNCAILGEHYRKSVVATRPLGS